VPSYVVFNDASLQSMCRYRPSSHEAFLSIDGVGQQKLERYGDMFLDIIDAHPISRLLDNELSHTINSTLSLFEQGMSVDEIVEKRSLSEGTVYSHLAEAIAAGLLRVEDVLDLEKNELHFILDTIDQVDAENPSLKAIYHALDEAYDYSVIRCVVASVQ